MAKQRNENEIYIGQKPSMNYVLAALTLIQNNYKEIIIKARGRAISKAVDVQQILANRFQKNCKVKSIVTGSEKLDTNDRGTITLSSIEITISC